MDRRQILGTAAAMLVIGVPSFTSAGLPVIHQQTHMVTEGFYRRVVMRHPDLATMTTEQLEERKMDLLHLSNLRSKQMVPAPTEPMADNGTLTLSEQDRLDAISHFINIHSSARFLRGRPLADFGFEGIDQVHGNWQAKRDIGECGCITTHVFDHARSQAKAWAADVVTTGKVIEKLKGGAGVPPRALLAMARRLEAHRAGFEHYADIAGLRGTEPEKVASITVPTIPHYGLFICEDHKHLAHDPVAHHAAVLADNAGVAKAIKLAYSQVSADDEAARRLVG